LGTLKQHNGLDVYSSQFNALLPIRLPQKRQMQFPIWQYLNQPVFSRTYRTILNPWRFRQAQQVYYLERCWTKEFKSEERYNP
jgi:hypothetical protein